MPYHTDDRGVTTYSDFDTPSEYAAAADEERASYFNIQEKAFKAAEVLTTLIDNAYNTQVCASYTMQTIADKIEGVCSEMKKLLGDAP